MLRVGPLAGIGGSEVGSETIGPVFVLTATVVVVTATVVVAGEVVYLGPDGADGLRVLTVALPMKIAPAMTVTTEMTITTLRLLSVTGHLSD